MFNKILVANRGEIAIRIMRTCRELGVKTVAIFSDADKYALHAKYADEAFHIGPSPASQSYLNLNNIMDVAEKTGAEGIHPGYGFLSENPNFASLCEKSNLIFIGPSSKSMEKVGSKIHAKALMKKAGVPVTPGSNKAINNIKDIEDIAEMVGYPIVIKASAGGGGIGMKVVDNKENLEQIVDSTRAIAKSAFGDDTLYIEKYHDKPRHIEFQILADKKGKTIHLNERECSIQRRHQKLIEETPSPIMTSTLRSKMGNVAIKAAKSINYENAGTVEFIYSDGNFYFLEINTRLQVEHPITEITTGVDLVKEQLIIASGKEMNLSQEGIRINGSGIECRINAEDPLNEFLPSPGKITRYRSPGGIGIRVDSGVAMGYTISPYYDSMISKLVSWGRNRKESISRMNRALSEYIITGITTNLPFHKSVMRNKAFKNGDLSTSFIKDNNILLNVPDIIKEDKERETRLLETFKEDKKVVAISAAVNSYIRYNVDKQQL